MRQFPVFWMLIVSFLLIQCEENKPTEYIINGKINGDFNHYIYLKNGDQLDSTLVSNGTFQFQGSIDQPRKVFLSPGNPNTKETMGLADFMLENSSIFISLNYKNKVLKFKEFGGEKIKMLRVDSISGSKSEVLREQFWSKMGDTFYKEKNDSLKTQFLYDNLHEFIKMNPTFVLSGKFLADLTNRHDYLTSEQIQELFELVDTAYQDERDLRFIRRIIKRRSIIGLGKKPPVIELPNEKNEIINHESFKGTYLLLEFWASWCGPCREANPDLINIYNSYNRKDFEILGISQDKDLDKWKKAIKKDQLTWPQVVDTINSSGKAYQTTTIPFNVLLDRDGKIIAREIKPTALKKILEERIGK